MSVSPSMMAATASLNIGWSSTTTTRIFSLIVGPSCFCVQNSPYGGTFSFAALNLECPAQALNTLAHAYQPNMIPFFHCRLAIEARALIRDLDRKAVVRALYPHTLPGAGCVLEGII